MFICVLADVNLNQANRLSEPIPIRFDPPDALLTKPKLFGKTSDPNAQNVAFLSLFAAQLNFLLAS
jgi:hypothetical protein